MVRRTGLIDTAVEELRGRIETEQWPVGTRIPPEPALVDLLGVGRNTVREAVQSLVHAGLLERRQGSGTYVLSRSELAVTMGRQIADARQRDVVEVRRALEVEAARLAALRRTPDEATALRERRDERAAAYLAGDRRGQRAEQSERRDGDGAQQADLRVAQGEVLPDHLEDRGDGRDGDAQVEPGEHDAGQHDDAAAPGCWRRHEGRHDEKLLVRAGAAAGIIRSGVWRVPDHRC